MQHVTHDQHDRDGVHTASVGDDLLAISDLLTVVYGEALDLHTWLARIGLLPDQIQTLCEQHHPAFLAYMRVTIHERFAHYLSSAPSSQPRPWRGGLGEMPRETRHGIADTYEVARSHIRRVAGRALWRFQAEKSRKQFESSVRVFATSLVESTAAAESTSDRPAAPGTALDAAPGDETPAPVTETSVENATDAGVLLSAEGSDEDTGAGAEAAALLSTVRSMVREIAAAAGDNLSVFVHAHILTGSRGQVTESVVGRYHLEHLHGALRPRRFDEVKALVMQARRSLRAETLLHTAASDLKLDVSQLAEVYRLVATVRSKAGRHLDATMLTHILYGSRGPVVNALVADRQLTEYGVLRSWGFTRVKAAVTAAVAAHRVTGQPHPDEAEAEASSPLSADGRTREAVVHADKERALAILRGSVGKPDAMFHEGQWEAIEALVERRAKLLVVRQTGWGKSLVYFMATRLLRDQGSGPTLLISPLLALMRNQILAAKRLGVRAQTLNSGNRDEWEAIQAQLRADRIDVLIVSPERLANDTFVQQDLAPIAQRVALLVIDEAHCISDWGHDFRPDYQRIPRIIQALPPTIPLLATTATANQRVVLDVVAQLGADLIVSRGPLARASLQLQTIILPSHAARMAWLAERLPALPGSGIVYTLTQRDAERVAIWLQTRGIDAAAYHAGVSDEDRERLETALLNNQVKALVATSALGMGFDKPDLGFVIHYQRPGSAVHYYQQVGRAGRALSQAYGVLLGGSDDADITEYFIQTAFPPEGHVQEVLAALQDAEDGLTMAQLEQQVNLSRSQLVKVLKMLRARPLAPVATRRERSIVWYATPVRYQPDTEKISRLTAIRRAEQQRMLEYLQGAECLMRFLARELDDPDPALCGRCAVCRGAPLLPSAFSPSAAAEALAFLRRDVTVIKPKKRWKADALIGYGWTGDIGGTLQAEEGRTLSVWGDEGWGRLVQAGKLAGHFDEALIPPLVALIQERWQPDPAPTWVTCVPSLTRPSLVPDLARCLARALGLPFVLSVRKVRASAPQKTMQNSYQQARNLDGVFEVAPWDGMGGPVLLVDDMVDSGWTFTVIAALLRQAGSGPVYPLALADSGTAADT